MPDLKLISLFIETVKIKHFLLQLLFLATLGTVSDFLLGTSPPCEQFKNTLSQGDDLLLCVHTAPGFLDLFSKCIMAPRECATNKDQPAPWIQGGSHSGPVTKLQMAWFTPGVALHACLDQWQPVTFLPLSLPYGDFLQHGRQCLPVQ